MKRNKNWTIVLLCGLLFLCCAAGALWVRQQAQEGQIVEIIQDGTVLYTINLAKEQEKRVIEYEYQGRGNQIVIENQDIRVEESDCMDQICRHMGTLKEAGMPIVCLPNHLIIWFADS